MAEFIEKNYVAVIAAVVLLVTLLISYIIDQKTKRQKQIKNGDKLDNSKQDEFVPIDDFSELSGLNSLSDENTIGNEDGNQFAEKQIEDTTEFKEPEEEKLKIDKENPPYDGGEYFQTISEKLRLEDEKIEQLLKPDNVQKIKNSINYNGKKYSLNQQSTIGNIHLDHIDLPNIKLKPEISDDEVWK